MAVDLATAYVTILPSMKGMRKGIASELGVAAEEGKKGFLSRIGGLVPGVGKVAGIAGGLLTGAIAGVAVTGGFNRAMAIEQAQAKLSGLGHDTKNVEKIMDNASAAVKGTAYGLGDAATVAASAVAAGVKPGQELQDVLTLVGDAASIAGTDMGSMGAIFNKVKASNKLQMDSINQLHDAGIPALALVAERLGVTAEEASKMASEGKIDFETFAAAMQDGMGGAAQKSGETFTGALANTKAALGRIGETFLAPFLGAATTALTSWAIPALDALNATLKPIMAGVGAALSGAVDLINSKLATVSEAPLVKAFGAIKAEVAAFEGDWYSLFTAGELGYAVQQALGVGENHPIVRWVTEAQILGARIAEVILGFKEQFALFKGDLYGMFAGGDFAHIIINAFQLPMESSAASMIRTAQGAIATFLGELMGGFTAFGAAWTYFDGEITSAGFPGWMEAAAFRIRTAWEAVKVFFGELAGGLRAFASAWHYFDGEITSAGFPGWMEAAAFRIRTAWESTAGFLATLGTEFATMGAAFMTALSPALASLNGGFGALVTSAIQLWQSLSPVSLIFQVLAPFAAELGALLGSVVGVVLQLVAAVIPLGLQLASVLVPMISQIVAALLPALGAALGAVSAVLPALVGLFSQVATAAVGIIAAVAPLVVQIASLLFPIFAQLVSAILPPVIAILNAVIPPILALATAIVGNLVPVVSALLPLVAGVFSGISTAISGALQFVQGVIQIALGIITGNWSQAWEGIKAVASGAWQFLVGVIEIAVGLIASLISATLGAISATWQTIWAGIQQFAQNTWDGISTLISDTTDAIFRRIGDALDSIASAWSEGWEGISQMLSEAWSAMESKVREVGGAVMEYLRDLPGRIKRIFSGAKDWLVDSGRQLLGGFTDGIKKGFEKAKDAVKGGLNKIREFFPFSPAKVGPFAGRGYTTFSGASLTRDFADAIAGEGRYLAQRTDDFMSSARFDTPMPTVPAVPDYMPASWSDRYGGDMQQGTQAQAEALAEALRGVEVRIDGRKTVGYLDTVRRT